MRGEQLRPFDSNGAFVHDVQQGRLGQLVTRGAGVTVVSGGVGVAVQMVSAMILGRLLTPADYGIVTMVVTFSTILMNIGFNGFTEGVVQRETIDHQLVSNLFWINISVGLILTIGLAASGSLLAWFYGEPRVARVTAVMSLTILFNCSSVLHLALLKRAMRFTQTSANEVVARCASVIVAILLAWAGWGYWALVAAAIALPIAVSIGAFVLCRWRPGRPQHADGTGRLVLFGMHVYGRYCLNYCGVTMDQLLLGWRFNARALGFYKKAYDLFFLSASVSVSRLSVVAVAALSRLSRDPEQYKRYLLNAMSVLAFIGMGFGAVLVLVGVDVIRVVLGPGWETSGRILTWFGFGTGIMLVHETHGWIHLSLGRADRWFRWTILELGINGLLFVLALPWGPIGMAAAWTMSFWILAIPAIWYAGRPITLGVSSIAATVWRHVVASALAGLATFAFLRRIVPLPSGDGLAAALMRILIASAVFGFLYLGATLVSRRGRILLYSLVRPLRNVLPWWPASAGELSGSARTE